jgi:hypothetical protein
MIVLSIFYLKLINFIENFYNHKNDRDSLPSELIISAIQRKTIRI